MKKSTIVLSVLIGLGGAPLLLAQPAAQGQSAAQQREGAGHQKESGDEAFVREAALGGMAEVRLGELARERGASAKVKDLGARMIRDHSRANAELKALAERKGIALPSGLDSRQQALVERLSRLSGQEFDRAYLENLLQDHHRDVREFERAARGAKDPELKTFAERTVGTLREHLQEVEAVAKSENVVAPQGRAKSGS